MELKEKTLKSEPVFAGRVIDLRVDTVELPDRNTSTREVIAHPGGVCVVAVDDNLCGREFVAVHLQGCNDAFVTLLDSRVRKAHQKEFDATRKIDFNSDSGRFNALHGRAEYFD